MITKKHLAIAIFGLLIASCSVVDSLLTFSIDNETSVTIPANFPVNTPISYTTQTDSNSSTVFQNNNTRADLVKDVRLKEFKLTITDPANKSFSFLKSIKMFISTNDTDEILLASAEDINSTSSTLDLTCTTEKLDKYVKASSFKLRVQAETKENVTQNVTIKGNMKFQVTADPF